MIRFDVVTLFPEMFEALTASGVSRRAYQQALFTLNTWNPRVFTEDRHKTVDDRPYGGGPGMVMMYPPLKKTVDAIHETVSKPSRVVYLSPQGAPITQHKLIQLQSYDHLTLVCGRYEGIDERFIEQCVDEEVCVGDFVVSGGELPAMMLMDALIRLIPGALGHEQSAQQDSFADGLLDCPHYTRPLEVDGMTVPDVLQQGNHAKIAEWRHQQKLLRTQHKRPDLFLTYQTQQNSQGTDKS